MITFSIYRNRRESTKKPDADLELLEDLGRVSKGWAAGLLGSCGSLAAGTNEAAEGGRRNN